MTRAPIAVVGAGLAGLACAWHLQRRGREVVVFEAAPQVGGVLRTDCVDGFQLDRGFQVLQTAYPEARAVLDLDALQLHTFDSGACTRRNGGFKAVYNPLRHPSRVGSSLLSGIFTAGDAWRVLALLRRVRGVSLETLLRRPAVSTREKIASLGFSEKFAEAFLDPFYRGVFLERELATSSRIFEFTFRMFASAPVALPENGIRALPEQLAGRLEANSLVLESPVESIGTGSLRLSDGREFEVSATVVATDAATASRWVPSIPEPAWNAVSCVYFAAHRAPRRGRSLILDGENTGPVNHLCFPSEVCPAYAPPNRTLVSASVLGDPPEDDATLVDAVRGQLRDWWGREVDDWEPLRVDRIRHALPLQSPAWLEPATRSVRFGPALFVCGGHRETSSIGGALRSGRRAAESVLRA
ncbi:MAG: FAD-dependent oxidoreductase [Myxococcales bacterium]|nr:FAD-dependent oxidoreductase [Myxococcales bacterium]